MKGIIREKRKLVISHKRIDPNKIRELATIIDREADSSMNMGSQIFLVFSIDATDNSSYESQSSMIFDKNELIEKKVIHKVNMRYNTLDYSKNIEIQLLQSLEDKDKENYILVSGNDAIWVNGIIAELSECVNLAEEQVQVTNLIGWGVFSTALLYNIAYFRLIASIIVKYLPEWVSITTALMVLVSSLFGAISLNSYLLNLWPKIELQTGPNHMKTVQEKRKKVQQLFLVILVPLILAAIYDLIKSVIIK